MKIFEGKPIDCQSVSQFDKDYVETRCWMFGTYILSYYGKTIHTVPKVLVNLK